MDDVKLHRAPCPHCPFRKGSLKGYIGPYKDSKELIDAARMETGYRCHVDTNHLQEAYDMDVETAWDRAKLCSGALHAMKKSCHKPINKVLEAIVSNIDPKHSDSVMALHEVYEYHKNTKE